MFGGVPNGGHGGSDIGGDSGWMSGSMGGTPKKKGPNLLFILAIICAVLAILLYVF
jgi:hypothetical protein